MEVQATAPTNVVNPAPTPAPAPVEAAKPAETPAATPDAKVETHAADPKPVETAKPAEDPVLQKNFAALTRREKEATAAIAKAREAEAKWAKVATDPVTALQEAGWSMKDLAELVLNDGKLPAEKRAKIAEERIAKIEADTVAQQQAQAAQAIDSLKSRIRETIDGNKDKYELVAVNESSEAVYSVIEQHFSETGEILPIEDALEAVESHLLKQIQEKALKTQKVQRLLQPQVTVDPSKPSTTDTAAKPITAPTLTNKATTAPTPTPQPQKWLTDDESKAAAADLLRKAWAAQ